MTDSLQIACPDNELDQLVVREVLTGVSYPIAPLAPGVEINVVADIGAHVGAAAIRFHRLYPKARIYCYEPCEETVGYLRRNVAEFAAIREYGLSAGNLGKVLYRRTHDALVTTSALLRPEDYPDPDPTIPLPNMMVLKSALELNPLAPDLIKLDTEGCEVEIIRTAIDAFRAAKVVYVEYHRPDDRQTIEHLLGPSKVLFSARTNGVNQGELAFIERDCVHPDEMARNAI